MNCDAALPRLYDLVDGDIGRDEAVAVALHLGSCSDCAAKLGEIRAAEKLYAARASVAPPPGLEGRITAAVAGGRIGRPSDGRALGLAAAAAAACVAAALALGRGAPAEAADAASRIGAWAAQLLAGLRLPDSSGSLAAGWSQLMAWLAAPAVLGGGVVLLGGLLLLQIGGSAFLLAAGRREGRR